MEHTYYKCSGNHNGQPYCVWCYGGLSACTVCGGFEGSLPRECPGVRMTAEQEEDVYKRGLDFKDGIWHVRTDCKCYHGQPHDWQQMQNGRFCKTCYMYLRNKIPS